MAPPFFLKCNSRFRDPEHRFFTGKTRAVLVAGLFLALFVPGFTPPSRAEEPVESSSPALSPENRAGALFEKATEHYFAGRYRTALLLLDRVKELQPDHPRAYSYSGDIHLILGELELAKKDFLISLEIGPEPARDFFRLGQTYYLMRDAKKALEAFQNSLRKDPTYHIARFYEGLVYYRLMGNREKTIRSWKDYRALVPDDPQGPEIDRAIRNLEDPDFPMPPVLKPEEPGQARTSGGDPSNREGCSSSCIPIPDPEKLRLPYRSGKPEKEKQKNNGSSVIDVDDL